MSSLPLSSLRKQRSSLSMVSELDRIAPGGGKGRLCAENKASLGLAWGLSVKHLRFFFRDGFLNRHFSMGDIDGYLMDLDGI